MSSTSRSVIALKDLIDTLRAELAAARKDTERLDWLEGNGLKVKERLFSVGNSWFNSSGNLRATIDTAKEAKP